MDRCLSGVNVQKPILEIHKSTPQTLIYPHMFSRVTLKSHINSMWSAPFTTQ